MKYDVVFRPYTEKHYIRSFEKKYKGAWDKTLSGLVLEFTQVDLLFDKSIAEVIYISDDGDVKICKTEFKIAGSQISRHASGYRCIIAVCSSRAVVEVLLVYAKGDVKGSSETAAWKQAIRDVYPEYRRMLS